MVTLNLRKLSVAKQVVKESKRKVKKKLPPEIKHTISTGSTLLDLELTGTRKYTGGIPGGIIVEISGPPSCGKTAVMVEAVVSCQKRGGDTLFKDPEGRLDKRYAEKFGVNLKKLNYERPDTVIQAFRTIRTWKPKGRPINMQAIDSLAALSTEVEMESEDKRGQQRAKDFSAESRKIARIIANNGWLILCTNQEREGERGAITPGGRAVPYYATLRIRLYPHPKGSKLERTVSTKYKGKKVKAKKQYGIAVEAFVRKSSSSDPFGKVPVHIVFGYGVDDISANVWWLKQQTHPKAKTYNIKGKKYRGLYQAVLAIEKRGLEKWLRKEIRTLWHGLSKATREGRKSKRRT